MCSPQFESHGSQSQRQLKETLYDTIIDYFDKGKVSIVHNMILLILIYTFKEKCDDLKNCWSVLKKKKYCLY